MAAGGNSAVTDISREAALAALREQWKHAYDVGTVTVADALGPDLMWVAVRLEGPRPEPLHAATAAELEAALRADWGEEP